MGRTVDEMSLCTCRKYMYQAYNNKLLFFFFTALYIGFCHSFDIMSNTPRKIYYLATTIGETRTMCKLNSHESKDLL